MDTHICIPFISQELARQTQRESSDMSMMGKEALWGDILAKMLRPQGEVNRDRGLAAAPHLHRVSGCGRHPITHPYRFAKPAPMSLGMWREGHSAKWNLQVTHVGLL